jgi:hypothetical protein
MSNVIAETTEPRVDIKPRAPFCAVPAHEAQDAILKAFSYEGDLRVRHLWSRHATAQYRANWFRQVDGEMRVTTSLFLSVTKTPDGLVVLDETAV